MATLLLNNVLGWLFLFGNVWTVGGSHTRNSLNSDVLLPYDLSTVFGSPHSHRHVRDWQPVVHGNATYETWPGDKRATVPVADAHLFVSALQGEGSPVRWVPGHLTVVSAPLRTVSVLEPGGPGGCASSRTRTVGETARARYCLYAQNAGFFNMSSGGCLGNVVSDGRLVQNSGGVQNAQFGIRRDGTLVFGFLSEKDVLDQSNPFVQLVSGVVWLLRNGKIYINESFAAEDHNTQQTGTFHTFVNAISARTAVGHDRQGRLVLFHADGQTYIRGLSLWEMAKILQEQGVVNAINLDGGGSATFVVNDSLASYPSDHCHDPMWRCARAVSTVLCVHDPLCEPEDCSGHGLCEAGQCLCQEGWEGVACETLTCRAPYCGEHGFCTPNGCACYAGWMGTNCSQVCPSGFFGDGCNQTCPCANGGSCDPVHGRCSCPAGFQGPSCKEECSLGFYGPNCKQQCQCESMCPCDPATGHCWDLLQVERNLSLRAASCCLQSQQLRKCEDKGAAITSMSKAYLEERSWMAICTALVMMLLGSIMYNVIQARRGNATPHSYSYIPLKEAGKRVNLDDEPNESCRSIWDADERDSADSL